VSILKSVYSFLVFTPYSIISSTSRDFKRGYVTALINGRLLTSMPTIGLKECGVL